MAQTKTLRPNSTEDFFKRGVTRYQQGDLDGAFRDFDRAIEIATSLSPGSVAANHIGVVVPEPAAIYYNRGVTRYDLRDWEGALADFDSPSRPILSRVQLWRKIGRGGTASLPDF
jgi:hypothetical protein